jgi:hypothetical protein
VGLTNVWLRTFTDGLVRADQVVGLQVHRTPSITGKPSHWLLDVVLPSGIGGGKSGDWELGPVHRTLLQTSVEPEQACEHLARLLAQLDTVNASGVITASPGTFEASASTQPATRASGGNKGDGPTMRVRFTFSPFRAVAPDRHYDPEYL